MVALSERIGVTAVQAGPLANAVALESLTPVRIWINRNRKIPGAGSRLTGLGV